MTVAQKLIGLSRGFNPLAVTGLKVDADFTDATTLYTDTGLTTLVSADAQTIKGVADKSGQGNHLTDATGCVYKTNIVNGKSVGRFVIASGTKLATAAFGVALSQPNTIYVVTNIATLTGYPDIYHGLTAGHVHELYVDQGTGDWSIYAGGTPADVSVDATSAWTLHNTVWNGASSNTWVNGTQRQTNVDPGSNDLTGFRLGSDTTGASRLGGDIGRALVYSGAHSAADRAYITAGLGAQFGITVA